jgi:hypothetical protein
VRKINPLIILPRLNVRSSTLVLKRRGREARREARASDNAWEAVRQVLLEDDDPKDADEDGQSSDRPNDRAVD